MLAVLSLFATCPKELESLLAVELRQLGAENIRETRAGVSFTGELAIAYRVCLWSRLTSRVLLVLAREPVNDAASLYAAVQRIAWKDHLAPDGTLAVDFVGSTDGIRHSHFGALKVKDAIVDQLRSPEGTRPSIDLERPNLRVNVFVRNNEAVISIDLSGDSLHRRGYRMETTEAPLKENLAAAILLRADWPAIARKGGPLVDLLCGSGTLLIEGAMMAADIAPGFQRHYFGFLGWVGHDTLLWERLRSEAAQRREAGLAKLPILRGYDVDTRAIRYAAANITRAGLGDHIQIIRRALVDSQPEELSTGLVIANPPYGERLGESSELPSLYRTLGEQLRRCFPGWHAAIFTGNPELGKHMGIRARHMHTLYNGSIKCKLLHFDISEEWFMRNRGDMTAPEVRSAGGEMFANRLMKDLKHYGRWARREDVSCYRLYDADMHEYNLAIDVYESDKRYAHVQEYEAPDTIEPTKARERLAEALAVIPEVLEISREQMFFKLRKRQRAGGQYEKLAEHGAFHEVREGPCRLLVNFTDYLDTGLFLDHRPTRAMIGELSRGRSFLNLFAYTATATVHAGLGGATSTTSIDMSKTYLDWAQRNLELNNLRGRQHELVHADVLKWLKENRGRRFGLIFLDPPTFSRSKRMQDTLDVQRDHIELIRDATALLEPAGILIFSTNNRRFKLERDSLAGLTVEDITRRTIPRDFERDPRIHQCFRISAA